MFKLFSVQPKVNKSKKRELVVKKKKKKGKVMVLLHFAEWCENSQTMQVFFEHLKNRFDGKEVLFVRLDFTNKTAQYQTELLAIALRVDEVVNRFSDTGFIVLIDQESGQPFARLTSKVHFSEMVVTIQNHLEMLKDDEKKVEEVLKTKMK
ncbi:MAG: hypothetical protein EAZ55_05660 [Cytophagales bacterium]|nr:MAG: hypothetical protein EAZ55_05660 [Cytophagales bacterium]